MTIKLKQAACAGTMINQQEKYLKALLGLYEIAAQMDLETYFESPIWRKFKKQIQKCKEVLDGHFVE